MSNPTSKIALLIQLRLLVAYLGEKKQFAWWETSLLDATGRGFLERSFPRTAAHAATAPELVWTSSVGLLQVDHHDLKHDETNEI